MSQKTLKVAITAFLGSMLLLHALVAWNSRELIRKGYPDFSTFYAAGLTLRQGLGPQMYDEATQYRIEQQFSSGVTIRQGALPYIHPPFEALLFVPLTWLPYVWAYLLWDAISLLALWLSLRLLRPQVPLLQQASTGLWLLAAGALFPIFIALLQGQDSILLLLVFVMVYLSLRKSADFSAGCWLALGLFRFHLVLPLLFILLWQKHAKAIAGFSLVAVLVGLLSAVAVGWQGALAYPSHVWYLEQVMGVHGTVIPLQLPNIRGLLALVLPGLSKIASDGAVLITSLALIIFTAVRWRISQASSFDLGFSFCIIVTALISYHTMPYDLALLVLPLILMGNYYLERKEKDPTLLAPMLLLFFTPLQMYLSFRVGLYCLMALLIGWWGGVVAKRLGRSLRPA